MTNRLLSICSNSSRRSLGPRQFSPALRAPDAAANGLESRIDNRKAQPQVTRVESSEIARVIQPLNKIAEHTPYLLPSLLSGADSSIQLHRYVLAGPHGGGDPVKIGIFAGVHGDEKAGSLAIAETLRELLNQHSLTTGYHLHFYPVCNPTGYEKGSRLSASGKDLNREFWKNSQEPEVKLLEQEIQNQRFDGLISLHSDDTSDGMYGFVRGAVLTASLLEPALAAAEKVLPRNLAAIIDGFPARNGIISQCYDGILTAPSKLEKLPFEIILETPQIAPMEKQVAALRLALFAILEEYQKFIAFAANL